MAEAICQHIRALGIDHRQSQLPAKVVTVSVGGACLMPSGNLEVTVLMDAADRALYQSKHQGRDRVTWHRRGGSD
ncbi:hypothetical protein PROH_21155 [Prochlorothrix hollandica PCC 9006 = CALU 1027]|uniref:GGDEF domain-containing protein n=1 Tax=Prochlorothrix hollandica PCC 9006 = CALU 1027 TaxID=317619 RepID=A0A0M2PSP8_PROHO|nr:hypothetical protein PROH_21155 [Prochlorothrix hollandica PCC 9006 = CALU 1027]